MNNSEHTIQALGATEVNKLETIAQQVLSHAKDFGATSAEVATSISTGLATSVRLGEVETISFHRDKGVGITVYFGQKKGSASTSDTTPDSLEMTVKAACNIAKYTSEDKCAGLADPDKLAKEFKSLSLTHPWAISAQGAIEIATECENYARGLDKRIVNSEGVEVSSGQSVSVYANSNHFMHHSESTRHGMSCVVIGEKDNTMERDYWYSTARAPQDLENSHSVAKKAVSRTVNRLGAEKLSTRQAPVVFACEIASGLISSFIGAIKGGSLYRKASFLLDQLGNQVFAPQIRIHEDPFVEKGFASRNYDAEGVAVQARDIVRDGILQGYVLSSYSARKLGMETTGNASGTHNLYVEPSAIDFAGLLQKMGTGLLVTEVMGQGVNIVTGDYSRGASGFWVENGEIKYPVHEITIAGNMKDMFKNIVAVANDLDTRGSIITGSILVESMTIAGA